MNHYQDILSKYKQNSETNEDCGPYRIYYTNEEVTRVVWKTRDTNSESDIGPVIIPFPEMPHLLRVGDDIILGSSVISVYRAREILRVNMDKGTMALYLTSDNALERLFAEEIIRSQKNG